MTDNDPATLLANPPRPDTHSDDPRHPPTTQLRLATGALSPLPPIRSRRTHRARPAGSAGSCPIRKARANPARSDRETAYVALPPEQQKAWL